VRRIRDAIRRAPPHASLDLEPASLGVLEYADLVRAFNEVAARLAATEAELIQAEKTTLLGQLASGIAHEVGTPLNVISGYAQYLMRRFPDPELHEVLEKIVRQAGRLAEMIRRVLDFARPHPVQLGAVDLGEVVRLALEVSAAALRTPRVDVDLAAGTPAVRGDARLLEHALVNLLVNAGQACHAAPDGGHIEISVGVTPSPDGVAAPTWVYCRVADNGSGIAPEHRDKLFEPFFTTKAQGEGTGLGLAMVERIARQHGGEVDVVSEPGQKTAFTLRLRPALPAEELTPDG
jgi:signal transduction histidine kinase